MGISRGITGKLMLAALLVAQEPLVRTNVPLVAVPVSVTDGSGNFVYGLGAADFKVLDNGVSREVRVDDPDAITSALDMVVLIQTSDIANSALLKIRKVGTMLEDVVAGARGSIAVVTYGDRVMVAQDFTGSDAKVSEAFGKLRSSDTRDGRLVDAVARGLQMLAVRPRGARAVMLIIGESKDRGSETRWQDLTPEIQRSGVTIYSLAYSAYLTAFTTKGSEYQPPEGGRGWILDSITEARQAGKQDTCKMLTGASGGRQLKFETKSKLEKDLMRLGRDIHSRYIVTFAPPTEGAARGFHQIAVEVKGRPELGVAARPGYWVN